MADIQDLQYLLLHFNVIEGLHSNLDHVRVLILTSPEHGETLLETHRHLLLTIKQLEEQQ